MHLTVTEKRAANYLVNENTCKAHTLQTNMIVLGMSEKRQTSDQLHTQMSRRFS